MILIIAPACIPDQMKESPTGLSDYPDKGYYKMDTETILNSLDQGEANVFTPILATPEAYEYLYTEPFPWKQSDYLKVADALHRYVWGETLDGWSVYNLLFYGDCRNDRVGLDHAKITYFKAVGAQDYTAREIDIAPLFGEADAGGGANFPRPLFGWNSINLKGLKVTADDVLGIAERNGGDKARLAVENACRVFITLMPSASRKGWLVSYYSNTSAKTIFEIAIDPYTGWYLPP